MVYGSFKYDDRRNYRDEEEEALGVILKGRDDGNDAADDADEEEEANDIMIATADSTRFKVASIPLLLLLVVLSCFLLGVDFGSGTATFSSWLLSSSSPSPSSSSSLPLSLSSSLSSYNNNIDALVSSTQDLESVATTHTTSDENIGRCQTAGTYSSVIDYKKGGSIILGVTYSGLTLKSSLLSTLTFSPDRCYFHRAANYHNHQCPGSEHGKKQPEKIVEAWQQCAEACNSDERCVTYSARVDFVESRLFHKDAHYLYTCYLHDHYTCTTDGTYIEDISVRDIEVRNTYLDFGYW
eukprot:CAMPEP_0171054324 /NCGR_PEP_ID=MMETSP0736-20130129/55040_1 /TAXON_ID=186038 /ORGANISM="Fragilariopsis kerguelensis, Strain L26-C5" /LENGTH=295 /DNA_ID=CAMNT_0011508489 /DNA_START=118 /DNA_END=1002 /DNA_ORIENTATION=-